MLPRRTKSLWHSLHCVFVTADVHAGHSGNLADPSPQFLVACRHYEAPPLFGHLYDTVICVTTLAVAGNPFEPWVFCQPQGNLVFTTELLKFTHDTVGNARDAFGQQTIHH